MREELLQEIESYADYKDGWDALCQTSKGPLPVDIASITEFVKSWDIPEMHRIEVELCVMGTINLQFYDEEGFTHGSVGFHNGKSWYSIVTPFTRVTSRCFDANDADDVKKAENEIKDALNCIVTHRM